MEFLRPRQICVVTDRSKEPPEITVAKFFGVDYGRFAKFVGPDFSCFDVDLNMIGQGRIEIRPFTFADDIRMTAQQRSGHQNFNSILSEVLRRDAKVIRSEFERLKKPTELDEDMSEFNNPFFQEVLNRLNSKCYYSLV